MYEAIDNLSLDAYFVELMVHKKILLVDDDEDDQEIFLDIVNEFEGIKDCAVANNGLEALDYLDQADTLPDIIFLDLNMPIMDGKQCLAALMKQNRLNHIPVVIFSTSSNPGDIADTKQLGAKGFITKPTNFDKLRTQLGQLLNNAMGEGEFVLL